MNPLIIVGCPVEGGIFAPVGRNPGLMCLKSINQSMSNQSISKSERRVLTIVGRSCGFQDWLSHFVMVLSCFATRRRGL